MVPRVARDAFGLVDLGHVEHFTCVLCRAPDDELDRAAVGRGLANVTECCLELGSAAMAGGIAVRSLRSLGDGGGFR